MWRSFSILCHSLISVSFWALIALIFLRGYSIYKRTRCLFVAAQKADAFSFWSSLSLVDPLRVSHRFDYSITSTDSRPNEFGTTVRLTVLIEGERSDSASIILIIVLWIRNSALFFSRHYCLYYTGVNIRIKREQVKKKKTISCSVPITILM